MFRNFDSHRIDKIFCFVLEIVMYVISEIIVRRTNVNGNRKRYIDEIFYAIREKIIMLNKNILILTGVILAQGQSKLHKVGILPIAAYQVSDLDLFGYEYFIFLE